MINQIEFDISNLAYDSLVNLLKIHTEYSYVRFSTKKSCCNKFMIQIILDDKIDETDIILDYNDLKLIYNPTILKEFYKITLIYENDTFKVKGESLKKASDCKSCTHKSTSCNQCSCKK